jgi:hypothetical protein
MEHNTFIMKNSKKKSKKKETFAFSGKLLVAEVKPVNEENKKDRLIIRFLMPDTSIFSTDKEPTFDDEAGFMFLFISKKRWGKQNLKVGDKVNFPNIKWFWKSFKFAVENGETEKRKVRQIIN